MALQEHAPERRSPDVDRVVCPWLLEGRQGREGRARLFAKIPLYGDMGEDDGEEDEIAEVVTVLDEAAIGAAAPAGGRARQDEDAFPEIPGELAISGKRRIDPSGTAHGTCFGTLAAGAAEDV